MFPLHCIGCGFAQASHLERHWLTIHHGRKTSHCFLFSLGSVCEESMSVPWQSRSLRVDFSGTQATNLPFLARRRPALGLPGKRGFSYEISKRRRASAR